LEYIFEFLNAYNFSSDQKAEIQKNNKTIINAAVLGLIFEKINGYKDGSFYTPSFITTFISREILKSTIIQKFSKSLNTKIDNFEQLKDLIEYSKPEERQKANDIINSIKICDPAVGSGHLLYLK
jgi:type II restriction/modification system DNA methylase subunit YeeA